MIPTQPCARAATYLRDGLWRDDTVWDAFAATATRQPDRIALVEGDTRLAFRDVTTRAALLAGGLAVLGIAPGDAVAVQLRNWWEMIVALLATARLGAIAVPILPIHRAREVRFILRQTGARAAFIPGRFRDCDHRELVAALRADLPALTAVVVARDTATAGMQAFESLAAGAPPPAGMPGDVALVMYTSGTTADPKGVLHSHQTLLEAEAPRAARRDGRPAADREREGAEARIPRAARHPTLTRRRRVAYCGSDSSPALAGATAMAIGRSRSASAAAMRRTRSSSAPGPLSNGAHTHASTSARASATPGGGGLPG